MALTLRDCLLLADVIVPAAQRFKAMPRDREGDVAVFLCHGVILEHVPQSAAAQAATPRHRRHWECPRCHRPFDPQVDRRRDVERCFEEGNLIEAYKIVRAVGMQEGWYDPAEELAGKSLERALYYYGDGYQNMRNAGLGVQM
jgi:hypothetical protein